MLRGVHYKSITDEGLWIEVDGHDQLLRRYGRRLCWSESVKDVMPSEDQRLWLIIILLVEQSWLLSWMPSVQFVKGQNWQQNCKDLMKLYAVDEIHCNFHLSVA